jgi:catechol 2,3-dioxygenase-like lactoylglutathione lyase family enzyme
VTSLSRVDHAVIAVRDLSAATRSYASLLGCAPWWRGIHPQAGTENSLFRFENASVELLARTGEGPLGRAVTAALERSGEGLVALAFGTDDAQTCADELRSRGIEVGDPQPGEGKDPESGALRRWRTVALPLSTTRGLFLFAIEREPEPSAVVPAPPSAAAVHALDHLVVTSGDLEGARALYAETLGLRLALDRSFASRDLRILFFRLGGVTVEVVGRLDAAPDPTAADGFGGLAYRVADADAARSRVASAGFDVSEVRPGAKPGTRVCTVRSGTCGVPTLLIEPTPPATQPASR